MKEIQGYSFKDYYLEDDDVNPCLSLDNILLNGFVYVPISPDGKGDAYDILKVSASLSFLLVTPFWNTVSSPPLPCPEGLFE